MRVSYENISYENRTLYNLILWKEEFLDLVEGFP